MYKSPRFCQFREYDEGLRIVKFENRVCFIANIFTMATPHGWMEMRLEANKTRHREHLQRS